ncbi:hypothetical protein [Sphingomonas yantingensis]|uniref:Uncharacterized protein n=1 Tax=Sphingomonas yantingensis TaxID=1241761 RepID=A0A7W9AT68_9SPHN|nr:hypothetical protein [Sphingomonas yantingensis]MBB5700135.1 hypothetical protein [Sphingomonas yantingensis]
MIRRYAATAAAGALLASLALAPIAQAQTRPDDPSEQAADAGQLQPHPSRTAETGTGVIGQRQTAAQAAPNLEPLGRVNNRVANRVQNRIRNRIDRYYDPRANATSPFEIAGEQVQRASSRPR